jgi:uncharacterized protein (DUF1778 family)
VRAWLFADQVRLIHQAANLEATDPKAKLPHHAHQGSGACRVAAEPEQLLDFAAKQ